MSNNFDWRTHNSHNTNTRPTPKDLEQEIKSLILSYLGEVVNEDADDMTSEKASHTGIAAAVLHQIASEMAVGTLAAEICVDRGMDFFTWRGKLYYRLQAIKYTLIFARGCAKITWREFSRFLSYASAHRETFVSKMRGYMQAAQAKEEKTKSEANSETETNAKARLH